MEKITLYITSDLHGSVMPYSYADNCEKPMGMAKMSHYIKTHRDSNTIVIDNGDVLEGNALVDYCVHHQLKTTMSDALALMGVDYINVGNHDFNYGEDVLFNHVAKFHCITGNVKFNDKPLGNEYTIHEFCNGKKMALIGVVTQYVNVWEKPSHIINLTISDAFEYVKQTVAKVKAMEEVDYIAVVYHGGFECDLQTGQPSEKLTGENQGYRMIQEIEGIDILITGHQHRSLAQVVNGVAITQTAFMGKELACITIDDTGVHPRLIVPDCDCDTEMMDYFSPLESKVQQWLDQPLGTLENDLLVNDGFKARLHKHPIISFFNQVEMETSGAQLAANALFNDAKGFNATITMRDLVSTYVYPNTMTVIRINGRVLKQYLEKCAEYFVFENGKITVNPSYVYPKPQHYNYDMVDGINYTINVSQPIGQRISALMYENKPVNDEDTFTMAINNYRAVGGGNFDMIPSCEVVKEYSESMVTLLSNYILAKGNVTIKHNDNIKVSI